jgi:phage/plasmid-associated DNA primase
MSPTIHYVPNTYSFSGNNFPTCSQEEFLTRLQNKLPTYEVVTNDTKVKYYFDFDYYIASSEFDLEVANHVNSILKKRITDSLTKVTDVSPKIHILQAHSNNIGDGRGKYSLRYYISNMIALKQNVKDFAIDLNKYFDKNETELWDYIEKPVTPVFDTSVYDSNKKMRCYETNKPNEVRPLVLEEGTVEGTVITGCFDGAAIELNYVSMAKAQYNNDAICYKPNETELKMTDIDYLLNVCIREKMCSSGNHSDWNIIGQILKNELKDDATQPFVTWTNKFGSENKKNECINQITKFIKYTPLKAPKRLTFKTLHYYAKIHNPGAYASRFIKVSKSATMFDFDLCSAGDYEFASYFKKEFGSKFKCVSIKEKNIYCFNDDNLWTNNFESGSKIREILSNEMKERFIDCQNEMMTELESLDSNTDVYEKLSRNVKRVSEICVKLSKTNDKNNILREILDKIEDITFANDLNKKEYMLPIKGKKMFNMKTLEVTDRTIEDKFDYECDAEYITMEPDNETYVRKYFMDLFSQKADTVQTVLDILKSIFAGVRTRYIYFFTGEGCNGKSLLFKVLESIFKKAMDTIDKNVIVDNKISSQLTTQFEKLDKCRLGYVTELKSDMKLNETIIKQISGGDKIDFRGLFKANTTINPTCNLCVLTNEMPIIKIEKAIVDRLIKIPFLNTFEVDTSFETKLLERKDDIFSYIMKYGVIRDKFNLTEDMINSKLETVEDNTEIDYLQKFIEINYTVVPFVKKEKVPRDTFRDGYNTFLKSKGLPMNKVTDVKFTRDVKKYSIGSKESHGKTYYTGLVPKEDIDEDDE